MIIPLQGCFKNSQGMERKDAHCGAKEFEINSVSITCISTSF